MPVSKHEFGEGCARDNLLVTLTQLVSMVELPVSLLASNLFPSKCVTVLLQIKYCWQGLSVEDVCAFAEA